MRVSRGVSTTLNSWPQPSSQILPSAILHAAARDERLGQVLAPTVERAAESSIRRDPRTLVNILSPLMAPAIRRSIGEAIESMLQSLNEALKASFSWRGLKWRLEAWRTGTPFAAVVLQHTLVYRVEHVFLIHKESGLLIEHVAADPAASRDPQLISGMLSAIQDFVRDSFAETAGGEVDAMRLGELLIWRNDGPHAFLAAVIRGKPPESLHALFDEHVGTNPCGAASRARALRRRHRGVSRPSRPAGRVSAPAGETP